MYPFFFTCQTSKIMYFQDLLIYNRRKHCWNPLVWLIILLAPGHQAMAYVVPCACWAIRLVSYLTDMWSSKRQGSMCHLPSILGFREKQGKSEGFESCDRPIVRKRPIWVKIGDVLSRVTMKFDGWPWKTIGHLSFAVSSFVQHFIAIGEFKLELQSGNAQFGSNSTIFRAV